MRVREDCNGSDYVASGSTDLSDRRAHSEQYWQRDQATAEIEKVSRKGGRGTSIVGPIKELESRQKRRFAGLPNEPSKPVRRATVIPVPCPSGQLSCTSAQDAPASWRR